MRHASTASAPVLELDAEAGAGWAKGRDGEPSLGDRFDADALEHGGLVPLHDRRLPGTKVTIDHLLVGSRGIWVVAESTLRGTVRHVDFGGWLRSDWRLTVGGRDRTKVIDAVIRQRDAVRALLADGPWSDVPVRGSLCFVSGAFGWRFQPFALKGILVAWPTSIRTLVRAEGPVGPIERYSVAARLDALLAPA